MSVVKNTAKNSREDMPLLACFPCDIHFAKHSAGVFCHIKFKIKNCTSTASHWQAQPGASKPGTKQESHRHMTGTAHLTWQERVPKAGELELLFYSLSYHLLLQARPKYAGQESRYVFVRYKPCLSCLQSTATRTILASLHSPPYVQKPQIPDSKELW